MPIGPNGPNYTKLDQNHILQRVFDEANDELRTNGSFSGSITGTVEVEIDAASGDNISIASEDGSQKATLTTVGPDTGIDVNVIGGVVSGTFEQTGLKNALKTSQMVINSTTPTAIPPVAQTNRNGISVRNLGPDAVWIAGSITDTPGLGGSTYPKFVNEEFVIDITDSITFYACVETGKTANLAFMEVS